VKKSKSTVALLLVLSFILTTFSLPLVNAAEDSWVTLESMPTARHAFGVAVVDGKIYAVGGSANSRFTNINEMYDPETDMWVNKTSMPTSRAGFGIAVCQNKIFVFGGSGYLYDSVPGLIGPTEVYDPATDTWETKTSIPTLRENLCANVVNNKIYLIGGNDFDGPSWPRLSNKNEVYDPETDIWATKAPIPNYSNFDVSGLASAVIDDKIYLTSGIRHQFRDLDPTEPFNKCYDPETDTWQSRTIMPILVGGSVAASTSGEFAPKRIHILSRNTHQIYDPETDTWTNGTPMLTSRYSLGVAVVNDELYAIGGYNGGTDLAVNEKYTPAGYIPEFPSWIFLPLFFVATLVGVAVRRKVFRPT
jgi:N-acetylneuraminic acid mutarotase